MGDLPNRQKKFLLALTYGRSTEKCQGNVNYFRGSRGFTGLHLVVNAELRKQTLKQRPPETGLRGTGWIGNSFLPYICLTVSGITVFFLSLALTSRPLFPTASGIFLIIHPDYVITVQLISKFRPSTTLVNFTFFQIIEAKSVHVTVL